METNFSLSDNLKYLMFKSYYVVWKRMREGLPAQGKNGVFKSYYVVWKPIVASTPGTFLARFKSYYVVWKLDEKEIIEIKKKSLNRTM